MAQFNTGNNSFQGGNKTLFEVNQLATANGNIVSNTNPLPVTLGSDTITITGNVNVGTAVEITNDEGSSIPTHTHIYLENEDPVSNTNPFPVSGSVGLTSDGEAVSASNPLPVALGDIMGANVNIYTTVTANLLAVNTNIIPVTDNIYTLGNTTYRWESVHIGPGTLYIQDQSNSALNAALTVNNGILQIDGSNQLQVGQLKFVNNTIESVTGNVNIQIGLIGSSANLVLNRDTTLATGKTLTFGDNTTQNTAYVADSYIATYYTGANVGIASNTVAYVVPVTDHFNGTRNISLGSNNSFVIEKDGQFVISYSIQFVNTETEQHDVYVWLKKNGTNIDDTSSAFTINAKKGGPSGGPGKLIATSPIFFTANTGDNIQVMMAAPESVANAISIATLPSIATPAIPRTPASFVTITEIN